MKVNFTVSGERQLAAAFAQIRAETDAKLGQVAMVGAQVIKYAAYQNIFGPDWLPPKDPRQVKRRTGNLKRSLEVILESSVPGMAVAAVIATVFYAAYVEFGTSRMAARSYLRKAIREKRDRVNESMSSYLTKILARKRN